MSHDIKLEVCVDSIQSAIAAADGGASRIELCSALSEGGLTPTCGTLKTLKDLLNIPIFCMLRPRRGNDFMYSDLEIEATLKDMELLKENGADGFVFGALDSERKINEEQCQKILEKSAGLPVTFHRAFDLTNPNRMHETVERLIELGFKRILSSGFRVTASEGADYLGELIAKHHKDIIIMPGAGITVDNLDELLTATKCIEFHASARGVSLWDVQQSSNMDNGSNKMECDNVTMGKQDVDPYLITDVEAVRRMVAIAKSMAK